MTPIKCIVDNKNPGIHLWNFGQRKLKKVKDILSLKSVGTQCVRELFFFLGKMHSNRKQPFLTLFVSFHCEYFYHIDPLSLF